jgi:hypothetical protein
VSTTSFEPKPKEAYSDGENGNLENEQSRLHREKCNKSKSKRLKRSMAGGEMSKNA